MVLFVDEDFCRNVHLNLNVCYLVDLPNQTFVRLLFCSLTYNDEDSVTVLSRAFEKKCISCCNETNQKMWSEFSCIGARSPLF